MTYCQDAFFHSISFLPSSLFNPVAMVTLTTASFATQHPCRLFPASLPSTTLNPGAPTRASCGRSGSICSGSPGTPRLGPWRRPTPCPRKGWWRRRRGPATRTGSETDKKDFKNLLQMFEQLWFYRGVMMSSLELRSFYLSPCWGQRGKTNSPTKQTPGAQLHVLGWIIQDKRLLKRYEKHGDKLRPWS